MVRNPRVGETVFIGPPVHRQIGHVTYVHGNGDVNAAIYDEDGTYMGGVIGITPEARKLEGRPYWYWTEDKK